MALNFDKYAQEANAFMNELATELNHPDQKGRVGIILRAVMHTMRDRMTIAENFDLLAQLPMFLKAVYVENWKYLETPLQIHTKETFLDHVKLLQAKMGEQSFDWEISTEDIIKTNLFLLKQYVSKGEMEHIIDQMPKELKPMFEETK